MKVLKKHEFVCGCTQSGKTHYAIAKAKAWDGGVFFWNPQNVKTGLTQANGDYDLDMVVELLKAGKKIDYRPHIKKDVSTGELGVIVDEVMNACVKGRLKNVLFVVDECQIYARSSGENPVEDIATRGLAFGLCGLFTTQRPALTSNTLFTQSEVKTYFAIEEEETAYFKRQGLPMDEIQEEIKNAGPYHYKQRYAREWSGPLKV